MKIKRLMAFVGALFMALSFSACSTNGDEKAFESYKTEKIEYVETLVSDSDTEAVKFIVSEAVAEMKTLSFNNEESLDENKASIDEIVTKIEGDIKFEKADINDFISNGHFKETYSLSLVTERDAQTSSVLQLVINFLIQDPLKTQLLSGTTVDYYYESSSLFFRPDGMLVIDSVYTEVMGEYWKKVGADDRHIIQTVDYQIKMESGIKTKIFTIEADTTSQDKRTLNFNIVDQTMMTSFVLNEELYVYNSELIPPGEIQEKKNVYDDVVAGGTLEEKYLAYGSYEVKSEVFDVDLQTLTKHKIWYPSKMETEKKSYPLVVMANGTGVPYSQYEYVFEHLASWGFIVIGNNESNSGTGLASELSLQYILNLNKDSSSKFYGKIDETKIGSAGHSQGGAGAINAVTNQPSANKYKAVCAICPPCFDISSGLGYSYDSSKINIPCFINNTTGNFDETILPLFELIKVYSAIDKNTPKIMARYQGGSIDHGIMLINGEAYMTAWFLYTLNGDQEAANVFVGENAEIKKNSNWINVESNLD